MKKFEDMTGFKEIHPASPVKGGWREWVLSVWRIFLFLVDSLIDLLVSRVVPFIAMVMFVAFSVNVLFARGAEEFLLSLAASVVSFLYISIYFKKG